MVILPGGSYGIKTIPLLMLYALHQLSALEVPSTKTRGRFTTSWLHAARLHSRFSFCMLTIHAQCTSIDGIFIDGADFFGRTGAQGDHPQQQCS